MEKTIEKQTTIFTKYIDIFTEKLPAIVFAIVIIAIGILIAKLVKRFLNRILTKYKSSIGVVTFMINFVQVTIIIIAFMQAMSILGVNTTSFVAVLGAAGFSIGLAFKEVLSNLGSSLIILFFKPFEIGDFINCQDNEGTVMEILMFSTSLKTNDNKLIVMPNFQLTSNPVINYTAQRKRRIDFVFNVEYDTNVKVLYEISNRLFDQEDRILSSPKPQIGVESMNNNIIKFIARPWVKTEDYWSVYYKLMEEFKHEFDQHGIKFSRINLVHPTN